MTRCVWTDQCVFFNDEVGYSIDLHAAMRHDYCLGDNSGCARLLAMAFMPAEKIPADLLPTDCPRLDDLRARYAG